MIVSASEACQHIHAAVERLPLYAGSFRVPFDNGLYFVYEQGENSRHGPTGRIVRVGKNQENDRLNKRLSQHFGAGKNSSVFRKYLGGAFIRRRDPGSPCLAPTPGSRQGHWERQDYRKCPECEPVERTVSEYIEKNMSFRCVRIDDQNDRTRFERVLIATIAHCPVCVASQMWLGRDAYSKRVERAALWNHQHTQDPMIAEEELRRFERLATAVGG